MASLAHRSPEKQAPTPLITPAAPANDVGAFSHDTAIDHQAGLGNQGVMEHAGFGADHGEWNPDLEAQTPSRSPEIDSLLRAVRIAGGEGVSAVDGPHRDALFRLLCARGHGDVHEELRKSGDEAVDAAVFARDVLVGLTDEMPEEDLAWAEAVAVPALDGIVAAVRTEAARREVEDMDAALREAGVADLGGVLDALAAAERDAEIVLSNAVDIGYQASIRVMVPTASGAMEDAAVGVGRIGRFVQLAKATHDAILAESDVDQGMLAAEALARAMGLTLEFLLEACAAWSNHVGDKAIGQSTAALAKSVGSGCGAMLAGFGLLRCVAKAASGEKVSGEEWAKAALTAAAGVAQFVGATTAANVFGLVLLSIELSKPIIAKMEELQVDIIQGMMIPEAEAAVSALEPIVAIHDRALLAMNQAAAETDPAKRQAYLDAADQISHDLDRAIQYFIAKIGSLMCRTLKADLLGALTGYDQVLGGGFAQSSTLVTDLLESVRMTMESLPELALQESGQAR